MHRLLPENMVGFRGSHGRILDLIEDRGSRPSEIADGAWITKQAISKRIGELEDLGLVKTRPDPADGRAVLVRRTVRGDRVRTAALTTIQHVEREWSKQVGAERYRTFRAVLEELGRVNGSRE
jgi:DNA-binding MarR family transcriptional regulator